MNEVSRPSLSRALFVAWIPLGCCCCLLTILTQSLHFPLVSPPFQHRFLRLPVEPPGKNLFSELDLDVWTLYVIIIVWTQLLSAFSYTKCVWFSSRMGWLECLRDRTHQLMAGLLVLFLRRIRLCVAVECVPVFGNIPTFWAVFCSNRIIVPTMSHTTLVVQLILCFIQKKSSCLEQYMRSFLILC